MKFGLPISLFMHLSFAFGGLLIWNTRTTQFTEVRIIPLELVTVTEFTNIKPTRKKPVEPEPEQVEPETPLVEPEPEADPETPPVEPEPVEEVVETPTESPDGELLADSTPEEVPNVEPKPPTLEEILNSASASVNQARKDNPNASSQQTLQSEVADRYIPGAGEETGSTVTATEYIQSKMLQCYKIDTGAKDYRDLRVEVRISMSPDGEINDIKVLNQMQIIASPNNSWRAARDNVIFALNECAPYDKLPKDDYNNWKTTKLNFQPNDEG